MVQDLIRLVPLAALLIIASLYIGLRWIEGRGGTTFGLSKEESEIYLRGSFSF